MKNENVEMKMWSSHPQKIDNWDTNIDYVMFIDENGNSRKINDIFKKRLYNEKISVDEKYFTIAGVIFEKSNYSKMRNDIRKLKEKYWQHGYYYDSKHKDTRYVCLHSREIRNHTGAFNDKVIDYDKFINELSNTLEKIECKIISITINLENYILKNEQIPVYDKAFDLLLERYVYATDSHKKGIIMFESRGKNEDKDLLKHISHIMFAKGTEHIKNSELQEKIKGIYFNPKWYGGYSSTYAGLEIADLFSYPIHSTIKLRKKHPSFITIEKKIDCYPHYENKGIKIYPKEKDDIHHP